MGVLKICNIWMGIRSILGPPIHQEMIYHNKQSDAIYMGSKIAKLCEFVSKLDPSKKWADILTNVYFSVELVKMK